MGNQLNDSDFGTRDKRGHWKPFGTISINPVSYTHLTLPTMELV